MTTAYAGTTVDLLERLGLDPATDGPLIRWHTNTGGWTDDPDRSHALVNYAVTYGRGDATSSTKPVQVSVTAAADLADPPEVSDLFRLTLCPAAATVLGLTGDGPVRFTGEVTDVLIDPDRGTWQVVGVSVRARLGRHPLDLTGSVAATAHDRVTGVLAAIAAPVGTVDPDDTLLSTPGQVTDANTLLAEVVTSTTGQLVDQPSGLTDWHSPEHRRGAVPVLSVAAGEILSAITWAERVGSVLNMATINYTGGSVTITDHGSVGTRGEYPTTVTTVLAAADDAEALGTLVVGRYADPVWDLPTLTVDPVRTIAPASLPALLRLLHGDRVTITDLPPSGPVAGVQDFFVEGFTETAARWAWRIGLAVTDPRLSGVTIRWTDIDHCLKWVEVDPTLSWLDLAHVEDPDDLSSGTHVVDGGDAATTPGPCMWAGGDAATTTTLDMIDGGTAA